VLYRGNSAISARPLADVRSSLNGDLPVIRLRANAEGTVRHSDVTTGLNTGSTTGVTTGVTARGRRVRAAVLVVALAFALAGGVQLVRRWTAPIPGVVTIGGLSAQVHRAGWVPMEAHSMDGKSGYAMPAQMMPGAPAHEDMRLGVQLTLVNTDSAPIRFDALREFSIIGGAERAPRGMHSDTLGMLSRLGPGAAVDGTFYFDVKAPSGADAPLRLQWTRDGETVRIEVPLGDAPEPHPHTS
jgi:hypothetical protein